MYLKLINSNVKKTLQDYQIYIITLVVSSALFFSFISLSSPCNTIIADGTKYSDAMFRQTINLTVGLVSLIFFVLVNYVNNHMIKRRAKEFSIYMLLGMEQKKIAFLYFVETLEVGLLAILIGTIAGTLLSGALTSIVILATGGDFDYKLGFYPDTFFKTMLFFIFVFILVGVFNTTKLSKTKLINLLNADKTVEGHLQNKKKYFISLIVTIISFASAVIMIKDYLSTGRGYMSNIPSVVSNKYQLIIGSLLVCGIFSGYYAVSYIIYVVKERSKHYKYKKLNGVFISNLYARSASNAKAIASATIAIAVSILGFVVAPVLADISEEFLKFRMPYDLMINNSYRYIDKKSDIPHIDFSFVNRILNEHGIKESEICQQEGYFVWASNFENMETRDNKWDMPRLAVSLSDYNQMRKMAGLSPIELAEDEFALQASNEIDTESMKAKIEAADHEITLDNGQKIKLSENPIYNDAVGEYLYNFGNSTSFIFPDSICENLDIATTCYYVNTVETIPISICKLAQEGLRLLEEAQGVLQRQEGAGGGRRRALGEQVRDRRDRGGRRRQARGHQGRARARALPAADSGDDPRAQRLHRLQVGGRRLRRHDEHGAQAQGRLQAEVAPGPEEGDVPLVAQVARVVPRARRGRLRRGLGDGHRRGLQGRLRQAPHAPAPPEPLPAGPAAAGRHVCLGPGGALLPAWGPRRGRREARLRRRAHRKRERVRRRGRHRGADRRAGRRDQALLLRPPAEPAEGRVREEPRGDQEAAAQGRRGQVRPADGGGLRAAHVAGELRAEGGARVPDAGARAADGPRGGRLRPHGRVRDRGAGARRARPHARLHRQGQGREGRGAAGGIGGGPGHGPEGPLR